MYQDNRGASSRQLQVANTGCTGQKTTAKLQTLGLGLRKDPIAVPKFNFLNKLLQMI